MSRQFHKLVIRSGDMGNGKSLFGEPDNSVVRGGLMACDDISKSKINCGLLKETVVSSHFEKPRADRKMIIEITRASE